MKETIAIITFIALVSGVGLYRNVEKEVWNTFINKGPIAAYQLYKSMHPKKDPTDPKTLAEINKEWANALLQMINASRQTFGAPPLVLDQKLCEIARYRAEKWLVNGYDARDAHWIRGEGYAATTLAKFGYPNNGCAENYAGVDWPKESPVQVHNDFMNSEGHRKNCLDPTARKLGIGVYIMEHPSIKGCFMMVVFEIFV